MRSALLRDMKLLQMSVGLPRLVMRNGEPVSTGIFKERAKVA